MMRGGIKPLIVSGHQAVDARQIDPHPLGGRVTALLRVPRFRLWPLKTGAEHHEVCPSQRGGQRLRHLTCPTEPADLSAHNR